MLTLNDGRTELWQWDTGRTLAVDADCSQVHFSNKAFGRSIDVDVVDGKAIIPDILLQTDKDLSVWAFVGTAENGYTKISKTFKVNRRNKPADYVFTPTDQTSLEEIKERLEYLEQNPVEVPVQSVNGRTGAVELNAEDVGAISVETDPTVPGWAKQPEKPTYTAAEVGALPDTYTPPVDSTLTQSGKAADAKAVGDILATLTLGQHTDGLIYIFLGGKPVGNGLDLSSGGGSTDTVYGSPVADTASYELTVGQTAVLGIKLSRKPTQDQIITLLADTSLITFSTNQLSFTAADWDDMQYVTVTIGIFDTDMTASIIMRNSDDLMTDTTIPVYLVADKYSVDMTIPDGQHVCTVDDFTVYSSSSGYVILGAYTGAYDNIKVPATMTYQDTTVSVRLRDSFNGNTTVQYIEIADNVGFNEYGNAVVCSNPLFRNCTNLIGVKFDDPSELRSLQNCFKNCSSLKWVDGIADANLLNMASAFEGCTSIEYIPPLKITDSATSAFNGCTSLKKIYGLDSTVSDFKTAFYHCSALEQIVGGIPESCTNLFYAFSGCVALHEITINAAEVATVSNAFEGRSGSQIDVYVPADSTTKTNLTREYGSSTDVLLHDIGTGDTAQPVVVWGDSTSSPNTPWTCWPDRLQSQITDAYAIKNQAVSGEYTTSTSARQGGNALKVGAFTIAAGTEAVEITLKTEDGHTFGTNPVFSAGGSFNPCLISGVKGTISASNGVYKFSRLEAGDAVSVADGTPATSVADTILNTADCIMLINLGINSGWDQNANVLLNQVQLMVDHFAAAGGTKYIICGPCAGQHLRTDALRQVVIDYESKAATAFGNHWLNLREYLIDNGLTENGLTASELDTERMASGLVPASLLGGGSTTDIKMYDGTTVTDDTHPNVYGAESIKNAFYTKGQALGYWN